MKEVFNMQHVTDCSVLSVML